MVKNMVDIEFVGNENMLRMAIQSVVNWYNNNIGNETHSYILKDDVCIVWFCKTLQNFKVVLATPLIGKEFYEFTYNGDKQEAYLDVYTKTNNQIIRLHNTK